MTVRELLIGEKNLRVGAVYLDTEDTETTANELDEFDLAIDHTEIFEGAFVAEKIEERLC